MRIVTIDFPPPVEDLVQLFGSRELPFVLDSSLSNDGLGQWSFFGAEPYLLFEGKDGAYTTHSRSDGERRTVRGDGLALLRTLMVEHSVVNL